MTSKTTTVNFAKKTIWLTCLLSSLAHSAPRPSHSPNIRVCAHTAKPILGFDISAFQPSEDWSVVKSDGVQFTFIKATEGIHTINSKFDDQWSSALSYGFAAGPYHFFHPKEDPMAQVEHFLNKVGDLTNNNLPPVLDWEIHEGIVPTVQVKRALTWLKAVEKATGLRPIIYTGPKFWNALGNPQGFDKYPLFIAHHGVACPEIPPPWSDWMFWQASLGPLEGVNAKVVDLDKFNGFELPL